jgi:hypothetical protein
VLNLKRAGRGAHILGTIEKHVHFGLLAPSVIMDMLISNEKHFKASEACAPLFSHAPPIFNIPF